MRVVHVTPSALVHATLCPTATNSFKGAGTHTIEVHTLSLAETLEVHTYPSGLVITRLPVPLYATAANNERSGDQATACQLLSAALLRAVHGPMTRLPENPEGPSATLPTVSVPLPETTMVLAPEAANAKDVPARYMPTVELFENV